MVETQKTSQLINSNELLLKKKLNISLWSKEHNEKVSQLQLYGGENIVNEFIYLKAHQSIQWKTELETMWEDII